MLAYNFMLRSFQWPAASLPTTATAPFSLSFKFAGTNYTLRTEAGPDTTTQTEAQRKRNSKPGPTSGPGPRTFPASTRARKR